MITVDIIRAAQDNDIAATALIIEATDSRIAGLASKAAHRMAATGDRLDAYREEFTQIGRIAVWESLPRFTGDSVDGFMAFMYATVADKLKDAAREERNGAAGADKDAVKTFGAMLRETDGNVFEAERRVQTDLPAGKRLSADRANAARLAWQGSESLDAPAPNGIALGESISAEAEAPAKIHAKVGRGAALEALNVLARYVPAPTDAEARTALLTALDGVPSAADVAALHNLVTVPADPEVRRFVLDALAILRSFVSTATDGDLVENLRDVSDDRRDERAVKQANVREALGKLSTGQRAALEMSFGINGATDFGWGDGSDLEGLADAMGTTTGSAKKARSVAKVSFAKHYIALVAKTAAAAKAWATAAEFMRKPGGRK